MRLRAFLAAVVLVFLVGFALQAAPGRWLHVRVEEPGKDKNVKINVPMALVESVLPLVPDKHLAKGKRHLEKKGLTVTQLREMWNTLKAEGDFVLAEVDSSEKGVRVFIEGGYLHVEASEDSAEQVNVNIPVRVVDALLSGQGEEINFLAAIQALGDVGDQEIVSVQDNETKVRIWIDETSRPGN